MATRSQAVEDSERDEASCIVRGESDDRCERRGRRDVRRDRRVIVARGTDRTGAVGVAAVAAVGTSNMIADGV